MSGVLNVTIGTRSGHSTSITPDPVSASSPRPATINTSASAVVVGGVAPFTYLWSWQSGGSGITLSATTSATCGQESTSTAGGVTITRTGTLQVVTTGANGYQTITAVPVTHEHTGSA